MQAQTLMSEDGKEKRAIELANCALELIASGQAEGGFRALREAASLAPQNPTIKEVFFKVGSIDSIHPLQKLCAKYVLEEDNQAGKDAIGYLARPGQLPADVAQECLDLVAKSQGSSLKETQDGIITGLLRESRSAREALAQKLQESPTCTFDEIYRIGDGSANSITALVLDVSGWPNELTRETVGKDVFQLFLAKLMEAGNELDGRALRGISRLLATEGDKLHNLLDEETFPAILSCLDYRLPQEVRSQATLATSKYLEAAKEKGQTILRNFIHKKLARHNGEDLIIAFSATAAIFLVAPSIASALFMSDEFIPSLAALLEKRTKSAHVKQAALSMLSAACVDTTCREAINKNCSGWLQQILSTGGEPSAGLAAVILAKIQIPISQNKNEEAVNDESGVENIGRIMNMFKSMVVDKNEANKQSAIEGLAYASVQSNVKEDLAADMPFFKAFLGTLHQAQSNPTIVFGGLTIIDNLTRYLPTLSEEQKRISQIKSYANAKKPLPRPEIIDEDAAVTKRCTFVVNAGTVSTLFTISKNASPNSTAAIFNILLSLSKATLHRGIIAQQGGIKLLLQKYPVNGGSTGFEVQSRRSAAHALARILISVDPSLVFTSGSPPLTSAIRPLLSLLSEDPNNVIEGPRDLLPTFETLLALTNLASVPSPEAAETIIRLSFSTIEDLLLGKNLMIQRASMELVCNLMACSSGIELFANQSKAAARRMHILLALADVDDTATRRAAGGALATVTEFEGAALEILGRNRGIEILLCLCKDDDQSIVHRGVVSVHNLLCIEGPTGFKAKEMLKTLKGAETLTSIIQGSTNREILEVGVQALKMLLG